MIVTNLALGLRQVPKSCVTVCSTEGQLRVRLLELPPIVLGQPGVASHGKLPL